MSDQKALPENGASVLYDSSKRQGLNAGDVVAFLSISSESTSTGSPMRVLAESREDEGGEERSTWSLVEISEQEGVQNQIENLWEDDKSCWLEVVRKDKWIGFRSRVAGNRFLQVRRKGKQRLTFFNTNFGIWEQFEFAHGEPRISWNRTKMFFRSRQLHGFVLTVEVVRIGDVSRSSTNLTPRSSIPGGLTPDGTAVEQSVHGSVFRAMGSILAKEWSSFAQREVSSRNSIERELKELNQNLIETRDWATTYVQDMKTKLQYGVNECLNEVNLAYKIVADTRSREKTLKKINFSLRSSATKLLLQRKSRSIVRKVFLRWKEICNRFRLCKRFETIVTFKHLRRVQKMAYEIWYRYHSRRRLLQRHMESMTGRHDSKLLTRCFQTWSTTLLSQTMTSKQKVMRAAAFHFMSTLRRSFEEWQLWIAECNARQEHFLYALSSNARTRMAFIFRDWSNIVKRKHASRVKERFARRRNMQQKIRRSLLHWYSIRDYSKRKQKINQLWMSRVNQKQMSNVFIGWCSVTQADTRKRYILNKYLYRVSKRKIYVIFSGWKHSALVYRNRIGGACRIINMLASRSLKDAFAVWRKTINDERRTQIIHGLINKYDHRHNHYLARSVFSQWHALRRVQSSRTMSAHGACKKMLKFRLKSSFFSWHGTMINSRRRKHLLKMSLGKMTNKTLSFVFYALSFNVMRNKQHQNIINRMETKRNDSLKSYTLSHWFTFVDDEKTRRELIMKKILKYTMTTKRQAFVAWNDLIRTDVIMLTSDTIIQQVKNRMQRLMSMRCLMIWREHAQRQTFLRQAVRDMIDSWQNYTLNKAFASWKEHWATRRRRHSILANVIRRMKMKCVGSAFVTWCENARDATVSRRKLDGFVHRWLNLQISKAFLVWHEVTIQKRFARQHARKCMMKIRGSTLENSMYTWRQNVTALLRQRILLDKFTLRMQNSRMIPAFMSWTQFTSQNVQRRERNLDYLLRVNKRRAIRRVFEHLLFIVNNLKLARKTCGDAFQHRLIGNLNVAFDVWRQEVVNESLLKEKMAKIVIRMKSYNMSQAFNSWTHYIVYIKDVRAILSKVAVKMRNTLLVSSFNGWLDFTYQNIHTKYILTKATARLRNRVLSSAFSKWFADTRFERRARNILERWTGKSQRTLSMNILYRWRDYVQKRASIAALSAKAVKRFIYGSLMTTFTSWFDLCNSLKTSRIAAEAQFKRKSFYYLNRVFTALRGACTEARRKSAILMQVCRRIQRLSSATYFKEWRSIVLLAKWYDMKLAQNKARSRRRKLNLVMIIWRDSVDERAEQLNSVSTCVKRKQMAQRFFLTWYWDAFDNDIQSALSEFIETRDVTMDDKFNAIGDLPSNLRDLHGMLTPLPNTRPSFDLSGNKGDFLTSSMMDFGVNFDTGGEENYEEEGGRFVPDWNSVAEVTI